MPSVPKARPPWPWSMGFPSVDGPLTMFSLNGSSVSSHKAFSVCVCVDVGVGVSVCWFQVLQ